MSVGHGELGLRSNLRPFGELIQESACRKDAYLEIHGAATVPGAWSAAGDAWFVAWNKAFDGVTLDVVGVKTFTEVLQRVETQALCQSTEGSYFYDPDFPVSLYVHLTDDADPNDYVVQARAGFFFGTSGAERGHCILPWRGANKLTDGGLNIWTSSTDLTNWTETNTGAGWSTNRSIFILYEGNSAARLESTGAAIGNAVLEQAQVCVVGKVYAFWGRYLTDETNPSTATLYARFGATTLLESDGRTPTATDGAALANTGGQWRNFFFYVSAHETAPDVGFMLKNTAATACQAWVDDVHFERVYRWIFYEPRLQGAGLPETSMGASDVYPGSEETGGGSITIANGASAFGSDYMERMFAPDFFFLGKPVGIRYGGAFQDGQEILDLELGYFGFIAGDKPFSITDRQAVIEVEEPRTRLEQLLPTRTFTVAEFAGLAPKDIGRRRAMFWGVKTNIRPTRISKDGTTLLGTYEVSDPTPAVNGALDSVQAVYAYTDEAAAAAKDTTKRITLVVTTDYTVNLTTGQIAIVGNPGPFMVATAIVASTNDLRDRVDFVANGVTYVATVPAGIYTAAGLATAIQAAMNAIVAGGTGVTVTYSNTTHKFTIAWGGAGTFQLLLGTGVNKHRSVLVLAGFTASADKTGAVSYVSDEAVFFDPDTQHVIRVDATGYKDTAAGTYTGTANAVIQRGSDILQFIFRRVATDVIGGLDPDSFIAARTACPQPLSAYLGDEPMTVQDVIDRLEAGSFADIVLDGSGFLYYVHRDGVIPSDAVSLFDRDYLDWEGYIVGDDAYGTVEVRYNQDPSIGDWLSSTVTNDETVLLHGRPHTRTFDTFLRDEADADDARDQLAVLARAPTRHFAFTIKGKLLKAKVGDIVLLSRDQAMQGIGGTGGLNLFEGRVLYIRKNFLDHTCTVVTHTNVVD